MLDIRETDDKIIVGFGTEKFLGEAQVPQIEAELNPYLQPTKVIQFDLTGVALMTSQMLEFLLSLRGKVADIILSNPSQDVRDVVELTKLNWVFKVVDVKPATDP